MNPEALLKQYLTQNHAMQLATSAGSKPWVCTVYFVHDKKNNLYWASLPTRRHSKELKNNPSVSVAVVVKAVIGEPVIGIQMEGTAEELSTSAYPHAVVELYAHKFKRGEAWVKDFLAGKTDHKLYKLTPASIYLFDEVNFPGGERTEVKL